MAMASIIPTSQSSAPCTLLAMLPEIRLHIFGFCIPQNLCFDFSTLPFTHRPGCPFWPEDSIVMDGEDSSSSQDDPGSSDRPLVHGSDVYGRPTPSHSALPGLLLLCRQITNEAKPMLYANNTFILRHVSIWSGSLPFGPDTKRLMRKVVVTVQPYCLGVEQMDQCFWDEILVNLQQLRVVIEKLGPFPFSHTHLATLGWPELSGWTASLTTIIEYIGRTLLETAKVVVGINEKELMTQVLEKAMPGRCVFQRSRIGHHTLMRED